jgi:hypothetical protein
MFSDEKKNETSFESTGMFMFINSIWYFVRERIIHKSVNSALLSPVLTTEKQHVGVPMLQHDGEALKNMFGGASLVKA